MSAAYYCPNCDLVLHAHETDVHRESVRSEHFGQVATTYECFRTCGACGDDVEDCIPCAHCGDAPAASGSDYCTGCTETVEREENDLHRTLISIARCANNIVETA